VFARSGFGAIPEPDNPHKLIAAYAKDMEVTVLTGHIHTTEIYDVGRPTARASDSRTCLPCDAMPPPRNVMNSRRFMGSPH
jgi:hypothetical protein